MLVIKRNGTKVQFDHNKISKALWRCFNSIGQSVSETDVHLLIMGVMNTMQAQKITEPSVEDIQRLVIQQLWSRGMFDAAEHYQNYREEHRKKRLREVPQSVIDRVVNDQKHFPADVQYYQFMSKFSRWKEEEKRRETWKETVYDRVCPWLFKLEGVILTQEEKEWLSNAMYDLEAGPAMRVVQMAGPALDRCNVGAYNCAYIPIIDLKCFAELLYVLMQGTGCGFSVEDEYVRQLPIVQPAVSKNIPVQVIDTPDDTEGWCDTFLQHLELTWAGYTTNVTVDKVRPKNARLKTKGGRSSGPGPFLELIAYSRKLIESRRGKYMRDIDVHDLCCMIGKIVQVGGVRRAAEISLSELESKHMRDAKAGQWWVNNVHRSMSNNSAVYNGRPDIDDFMEEWTALVKSKSGERGIFNREAAYKHSPPRRKWGFWKPGCNPCAEILLRAFQFCNLSIAVARKGDTKADLIRKVKVAAYFGKIQSMATKFGYLRKEWKENCEEERLLGVDITGHADCELLQFDSEDDRTALLRELNGVVDQVDQELSRRWGVNRSAANTTIKPGGDSAVFFNCASGVSPWFSKYVLRWVREPKGTPVAKFLIESGVPYADAPEAPNELYVFGFLREAPEGATTVEDMTAAHQFFNWLEWKECWAEHSVSATIYVEDDEWLQLGHLVYKHFDKITGLSFLPRDNGTYTYPPNEKLTEEKYKELKDKFPKLNWALLQQYETEDETVSSATFACVGDKC